MSEKCYQANRNNWFMRAMVVFITCHLSQTVVLAQYIPAQLPAQEPKVIVADGDSYWHKKNTFRHLDLSLTLGTTGVGIDLATPLSKDLQLRVGYDYMPPLKKKYSANVIVGGEKAPQYDSEGYRIMTPFDRVANLMWTSGYNMDTQVTLEGKLTLQNVKVLVDWYPTVNKNWHFTAGFYFGPKKVIDITNASGSKETLKAIVRYNQMVDAAAATDEIKIYGKICFNVADNYRLYPGGDGKISIKGKANVVKPYVGFGYGGRLIKGRDDLKISFDCGALIWGGCPDMIAHDGTNLSKDVDNIHGKPGTYMDIVKGLKVYPQLGLRLTKTLF